jgi:hypothetical protein
MWLLCNLFLAETRLCVFSRYSVEIFQINDRRNVMASTMENYGILRDAIPVAAELSDFFADVFNLSQRSDVC